MKNSFFGLGQLNLYLALLVLGMLGYTACQKDFREKNLPPIDSYNSPPALPAPTIAEATQFFTNFDFNSTPVDPAKGCNYKQIWTGIMPLWALATTQVVENGQREILYVPIAPKDGLLFNGNAQEKLAFFRTSSGAIDFHIVIYQTPTPQFGYDSISAATYTGLIYHVTKEGYIRNTYYYQNGYYRGVFHFDCNKLVNNSNPSAAADRDFCEYFCPADCECVFIPTCVMYPMTGFPWNPGPCYPSIVVPCETYVCMSCESGLDPAAGATIWDDPPIPNVSLFNPNGDGVGVGSQYGNNLFTNDAAISLVEIIYGTNYSENGGGAGFTVEDIYASQINCIISNQDFGFAIQTFLQNNAYSQESKTIAKNLIENMCGILPPGTSQEEEAFSTALTDPSSAVFFDFGDNSNTTANILPYSCETFQFTTSPALPGQMHAKVKGLELSFVQANPFKVYKFKLNFEVIIDNMPQNEKCQAQNAAAEALNLVAKELTFSMGYTRSYKTATQAVVEENFEDLFQETINLLIPFSATKIVYCPAFNAGSFNDLRLYIPGFKPDCCD